MLELPKKRTKVVFRLDDRSPMVGHILEYVFAAGSGNPLYFRLIENPYINYPIEYLYTTDAQILVGDTLPEYEEKEEWL